MQPHLSACRSAPHRAVLGLLRPALGLPAAQGLADDLRACAPEDIVRVACSGKDQIQTLLSAAFDHAPELREHVPEDLVLFLDEMYRANVARNDLIREQIAGIGAVLGGAGIPVVLLKGAAELVSSTWPDPDRRFLGDIDILVPEDARAEAVAAMKAAGATFVPGHPVKDPGHHHAPWMVMPGSEVVIEVHWRLGRPTLPNVPTVESIFATMRQSPLRGISVPGLSERMLHQVIHDQFNEKRFHARRNLSPRSVVDHYTQSCALSEHACASVRARLSECGALLQYEALNRLTSRVLLARVEHLGDLPDRWVTRKLSREGADDRTRMGAVADFFTDLYQGVLFDPERRVGYARKLLRPRELSKALNGFGR